MQPWCKTLSKPNDPDIQNALNKEKTTDAKPFVESIAVMSILSKAKCEMPAFLHINLELNAIQARDEYFELFVSTVKEFAKNYRKNTNGRGIVAVSTSDVKPLKRSRRAAGDEVKVSRSF